MSEETYIASKGIYGQFGEFIVNVAEEIGWECARGQLRELLVAKF